MNKQKQLSKSIVKLGVTCAGVIVGFAVLYFATGSILASSVAEKTEADRALSQDQGQVTNLTTQLDKSTIAEKRFLETQSQRESFDFSSNTEGLKDWLKNAIGRYRLSNTFKLSLTPDKVASEKELAGTPYEAVEHPGMKIEFSSITDTHAFSFIDDLLRSAPGFIVIESLSMKRSGDVDKNSVSMMRSGSSPYLIETKMTFNWVGLNEKEKDKAASPAAAAATPTPPSPGGN